MVNWCTAVFLLTSLLLYGYIEGQCPGPREPVCSSCINDTAACSRRCIGDSIFSRDYISQICTGHGSVIRNVDLSFNSLNYLDCSSTSVKLRILNISHNNITIDDCNYWENNCFSAFKDLEYIDLSFNRIKSVCNASTFSLRKLEYLNLSHNLIASLDSLPFFLGARNIRIADLSYNQIFCLPCDLLQNKPKLTYLNISYNNFAKFWICYNHQPEPKGIFDYHIYNSSTSNLNGTIFDDNTHSQFSYVQICVVSIPGVEYNSSMCYEDVLSNVSGQELLFQSTRDSNINDSLQTHTCIFTFCTSCFKEECVVTKEENPFVVTMETTKVLTSTSSESTSSEDPANTTITSITTHTFSRDRKTPSSTEVRNTKSLWSENINESRFKETLLFVVILSSFSVILITCAFSIYVVRKLSHIASQPISSNMKSFEYSKQSLDTSDKPPKLPRRSFLKRLKLKYTMKKGNSLLSPTSKNSFNFNTMRPLPKVPTNESPGVGNTLSHKAADVILAEDKQSLKEVKTKRNLISSSADRENFDIRKSPFCEKRSLDFYNEFSKSSIRKKAFVAETALREPKSERLTASLPHDIAFSNCKDNERRLTSDDKFRETESIILTEIVASPKGNFVGNSLEEPKNDENAGLKSLKDSSTTDTVKEPSHGQTENTVLVGVEVHPLPKANGAFREPPKAVVYNPSFLNNRDDKPKNNISKYAKDSENITLEPINLIALEEEEETLNVHTLTLN